VNVSFVWGWPAAFRSAGPGIPGTQLKPDCPRTLPLGKENADREAQLIIDRAPRGQPR
jgi:hypothetical protein